MKYVVGVFGSQAEAESAFRTCCLSGIAEERLSVLTPAAASTASAPSNETERRSVGKAIGAVVLSAIGMGIGFAVGSLLAVLLLPGSDPAVLGFIGSALLGVAGILGGAALGGALHELSEVADDQGYREALRQGRSVLIATANDAAEAGAFRSLLDTARAATLPQAS
jgi:MFS family permease